MHRIKIANIIPFDPRTKQIMLVRSTHSHPIFECRHKVKGIGGYVEEGETPQQAAYRELQEEFPNWLIRTPGTKPKALTPVYTPGKQRDEQIEWNAIVINTTLGHYAFQKAREVAKESSPEIWTLDSFPSINDCVPSFQLVLCNFIRQIKEAYGFTN